MQTCGHFGRWLLRAFALAMALGLSSSLAQSQAAVPTNVAVVLEVEGRVEFAPPVEPLRWRPCHTNDFFLYPGDQLRTGPHSRATVRLADQTVVPIGPEGHLRIFPEQQRRTLFEVLKGRLYFFRRGKPAEYRLRTPTVSAVVRGTEFNLEVDVDGATTLTLLNGEVALENDQGRLELGPGEAGLVEPGGAPRAAPFLEAANVVQWRLYYPGVLHLEDLGLTRETEEALKDSLKAYREGDLQAALQRYPVDREPPTPPEALYRAALWLVVGDVAQAEPLVGVLTADSKEETRRLARSLERLIAAVKFETLEPVREESVTATEHLAESYYFQSRGDLPSARRSAYSAVALAPDFAFGWGRVAEMEFSFGETRKARIALKKSLELAPRNAQSIALNGFVLAARHAIGAALAEFDRAIALDPALGNAWLGRGLCRIRRGASSLGLQDLHVAASLEPQRALLRSYLGKGFNHTGDAKHAEEELARAITLDPADPTAWLYSALFNQQRNRINRAVRDLEQSERLNDNRRVYRSRLLLDQDRAVRGANLAGIYQDAGMSDVSIREAVRAVDGDYANYSAHFFLANSYARLRDPGQANLRFDTAFLSEYLIGNLLAPVGAEALSPSISQNEYTRLFERDRLGFSSSSEYRSNGDWSHASVQFGKYGGSSYAAEVSYQAENGFRPNEDLDQLTLSLRLKHDLSPEDQIYFQAIYFDSERGDLTSYYDESDAQTGRRVHEYQEPLLLLGYHREWAPGSHTLALVGRLHDRLEQTDPRNGANLFLRNTAGEVIGVPATIAVTPSIDYENRLEIYTAELQQIWERPRQTFVVGSRFQAGDFDTSNLLGSMTATFQSNSVPVFFGNSFGSAPVPQEVETGFERVSIYGYHHWTVAEPLRLTAGVTYDYVRFPLNYRSAPISSDERHLDQVSPKGGIIWTPHENTAVRVSYSRSLGGVSLEESFRLEPTQVGGFNQAFRSLIPESIAGPVAGAELETVGVGWDQKFGPGTYLGVQAQELRSDADRMLGVIDVTDPGVFPPIGVTQTASTIRQELDYKERTVVATLNQLLGEDWSVGVRYRLSAADLAYATPAVPVSVSGAYSGDLSATLHQVNLFVLYHHSCGFFGEADSIWSRQSNQGYTPALAGDEFWQFNLHAGYRFVRRRLEVRLSLLNVTAQDYKLNPLNLTAELPRDRVLAASLRFSF